MDRGEQRLKRARRRVHRDHRTRQEVGAVTGEDVRAEDLAAAVVEHELDPSATVAERARLAALADVVAAHLHLVAAGERLLLGQPDAGELGAGEDRARNHPVVGPQRGAVEHVRDRDRRLVGGDVREHPAADRVSDRVHVRQGRAQLLVDLDPGRAAFDSHLLESEPIDDGGAADAEQEPVARDALAAAGEDDAGTPAVELDPGVRENANPLLLQVAAQKLGQLGLVDAREPRAALDDRHFGAKAAVDLRELERDRAGAETDEMARKLACPEEVVARREGGAMESWDVGDVRPGATRNQRLSELNGLAAALKRVLVDEARLAAEQAHVVARDLALVEGDPLVDHPLDACHDGAEVDFDSTESDAELLGGAAVGGNLGGPDQSLRGNAPTRDSGAADEATLEQRNAHAARARPGQRPSHPCRPRSRQRRGAAPLTLAPTSLSASCDEVRPPPAHNGDRKSTRLNSSHVAISYAVCCLKKKKKTILTFFFLKKKQNKNKIKK